MDVCRTPLSGVVVLTPKRFKDHRGFFSVSWNRQQMEQSGLVYDFVQDNHSLSRDPDTLRGMHYQAPPHAQAKLVRCGRGRLFDAVVDVRKGSPTYGEHFGIELSAENGRQLLVPKGFIHGFATLEPDTEIVYKVDQYYSPEADGSVHWDSCGIDWGLEGDPVVSQKDRDAISFSDFDSPFEWTEQ